jgi:hypothetical protein
MQVDLQELRQRALSFARLMYADNDPRQERCAAEFEHREYMKMVTPPIRMLLERIEGQLIEIRDLLKIQRS